MCSWSHLRQMVLCHRVNATEKIKTWKSERKPYWSNSSQLTQSQLACFNCVKKFNWNFDKRKWTYISRRRRRHFESNYLVLIVSFNQKIINFVCLLVRFINKQIVNTRRMENQWHVKISRTRFAVEIIIDCSLEIVPMSCDCDSSFWRFESYIFERTDEQFISRNKWIIESTQQPPNQHYEFYLPSIW